MENLGSPWFVPALKSGMVTLPIRPDRKLAMVAVANVGDFGAAAFLDQDKYEGQEIELAGDELTIPDALNQIGKATGRKINYQVQSPEDAHRAWGYDSATMYIWFDKVGYNPDISKLEKKYGIPLIRFADYIKTAPWINELRTGVKVG